MSNLTFEVCIIGQGLAGTALAWALRWAGKSVVVIDRHDERSASRVAAGLITPITGQRFVKMRRFDEFYAVARRFYRRVEAETGNGFLRETPMVRLFSSHDERTDFQWKSQETFGESLTSTTPDLDETAFASAFGGFEMVGARLNVLEYLKASRVAFQQAGGYFMADIEPVGDFSFDGGMVQIAPLGIECRQVVFCQGIQAIDNPWFGGVPFDAAKGELLTVRVPGLNESRVIHRGLWLSQVDKEIYRAGATYERDRLDCEPTASGRKELCARLRGFVRVPFEVVDQTAGVRPILAGKQPVLGFHPERPQVGFFNGLGSKGALQSPWLAEHFVAVMQGKQVMATAIEFASRMGSRRCGN